jgi:hypothetical protein
MFMLFAIIFAAFAMVSSLIVYSAITFRRFLAFVIGPPRWEPVDAAAEMEEFTQCLTGQRSIQIDEMLLGDSTEMWSRSTDRETRAVMTGDVELTPTLQRPEQQIVRMKFIIKTVAPKSRP